MTLADRMAEYLQPEHPWLADFGRRSESRRRAGIVATAGCRHCAAGEPHPPLRTKMPDDGTCDRGCRCCELGLARGKVHKVGGKWFNHIGHRTGRSAA